MKITGSFTVIIIMEKFPQDLLSDGAWQIDISRFSFICQ